MNINAIRLNSHESDHLFFDELNKQLAEYAVTLQENVENSPVTFVLIESGGTENKFVKILHKIEGPILLVSTNSDNSLPAMLEIDTYLAKRDIPHKIFVNSDIANLAESMVNALLIQLAVKSTKGSRLGVIGKPSDWLIASEVDYYKVKSKFGITLEDIDLQELADLYDNRRLKVVYPDNIEELKAKMKGNLQTLNDALRLYSALKILIKKYHLDGLTVRCFDIVNIKKVTACLALSLLNDEGYPSACEGDVPSLLTMFLIKKLINQETFMVNPSYLDYENNCVVFAHCTIPLKMCQKYSFDTHFETNQSIGVKGELQQKIINIVKLSPDLETLNVSIGKIEKNLSLPNACRTQIDVSLYDEKIEDFLQAHQANHVIISYDNHKNLFKEFLKEFK